MEQPSAEQKAAARPEKTGGAKLRTIAVVAALGGMVLGGVVEFFVQGAMESTGWFGPTLDAVINDQKANFAEIRAKLDALRQAVPGSPEAQKLQAELEKLLSEQEKLAGRTHTELRGFQQEVSRLKEEALEKRGSASGADFWLAPSESVTVRDRGNVFALLDIRYSGGLITVNASGKNSQMKPGDFVEFPTGNSTCKVFYKHGLPREDGRVGFDIVCASK
jgi:hypothetical protein